MKNDNLHAEFLHFPCLCLAVILFMGLLNSVDARSNSPIIDDEDEKHIKGITATCIDYSTPVTTSTVYYGVKKINLNNGTLTSPTFADKFVTGLSGTSASGDDTMPNGSYLTAGGYTSNYFYGIDFRLLPGLPAIFHNAYNADAVNAEDLVTVNGTNSYAEPGVYSLYVQYVLVKNQ